MQSSSKLENILQRFSDENNYIFTVNTLSAAFPELTESNLNQLLCRANKSGLLEKVCKGVYINPRVNYDTSVVLFKMANTVRPMDNQYVSLETVLSSRSLISQQMLSNLTIITSGRSGVIDCSRFGKLEFVHSDNLNLTSDMVKYDIQTGMYWATAEQALKDMKRHRRKLISLIEDK